MAKSEATAARQRTYDQIRNSPQVTALTDNSSTEAFRITEGEMFGLMQAWDRLTGSLAQESDTRRQAESERQTMAGKLIEIQAQFADLKERLHEAEVSKARLEGYLDRVAQDDRARDGHEVILSEGNDVDAKPRRSDQGYRAGYMGQGAQAGTRTYSDTAEQMSRNLGRKHIHWTSY